MMVEEKKEGVIVGASSHIEWMLPWWWRNYKEHNTLPVAFFDFGLSPYAKKWCKERGELISVSIPSEFSLKGVAKERAAIWEKTNGIGIWAARLEWFKKPFAFLQSPFAKSIWLDLDCAVRGELTSLLERKEFALVRESDECQKAFERLEITFPKEVTYNSGVVVFEKNSPIVKKWVDEVLKRNNLHIGDQNALSRVLFNGEGIFEELPPEYNWDFELGGNRKALIVHFSALAGKLKIKSEIEALSLMGLMGQDS